MTANTPENKVKAKIKKLLTKHKVYYHSMAGQQFGSPSLDYYCCYHGRFIAIEAKAPGKKLTVRQRATAKRITDAGGVVFMVSDDLSLAVLDNWLIFTKQETAL